MLRLIGDIHGTNHLHQYKSIIDGCDYSIQLGDMGFSSMYDHLNKDVDYTRHKFLPGNHDDYDNLPKHALVGDWGWYLHNWQELFYIRGGFSVDYRMRTPGRSWWPNEQISYRSGLAMIEEFVRIKPSIVVSHDCPYQCYTEGVLTNYMKMNPSITVEILTNAFMRHQPDMWIFGHHHNNWTKTIEGTHFVCLDECCYLDI